ncbi:YtpI family protein [Paenibacillus koleovorans]|uniref:YtpI family protein n=1 Tax=Paenibacillus koleovorans TaxID=121608 RepID=UPI000FDAAE5B|nr:YtpI family protein [Paenibacillus koleovorans]
MFEQVLQTLLAAVILVTLGGSVYFSFKHRQQTNAKLRGLQAAKMNICMGIMLIAIALVQMLMFSGSTVRVIIGAVMMLIGLFNLFAGIRNHGYFDRMKTDS